MSRPTAGAASIVPLAAADERCGGKASGLGRLIRAGFPVPDGRVVLDPLGGAWEGEIIAAVEGLGDRFAVRSSASGEDGPSASFAGQLLTVLDVDAAGIVDAVLRCAASAAAPGAVEYGRRMGATLDARVPVIVQRLVDADVAGVLFTRRPATGERQLVVEAALGLGAAVVDGSVTPQRWIVDGAAITERPVDPSPVLDDRQLNALAALGRQIEALFGCPQDVEWAIADGTIWILQARPITVGADGTERGALQSRFGAVTGRDPRSAQGVVLTGTAAGPGVATGTARVITGLDGFAAFSAGDVLVCHATSPAWTPLLARASAVVTEVGGMLSHAAIVAREFRIPAVVGVAGAVPVLRPGPAVIVDGTNGSVTAMADVVTDPSERTDG